MVWWCFTFLVVIIASGAQCGKDSAFGAETKAAKITRIQLKIESAKSETSKLTAKLTRINSAIERERDACEREKETLKRQLQEVQQKISVTQLAAMEIFKQIEEESEEHIRLEDELRRVVTLLELAQYQYRLIHGELVFKEARRENGTAKNCWAYRTALADVSQDELATRARRVNIFRERLKLKKETDHDLQKAQASLAYNQIVMEQLERSYGTAEKHYQDLRESCQKNKSKQENLMQSARETDSKNTQILEYLRQVLVDLRVASDSARLNIKHGKNILYKVGQSIARMKKQMNGYIEEGNCYNYFHALE